MGDAEGRQLTIISWLSLVVNVFNFIGYRPGFFFSFYSMPPLLVSSYDLLYDVWLLPPARLKKKEREKLKKIKERKKEKISAQTIPPIFDVSIITIISTVTHLPCVQQLNNFPCRARVSAMINTGRMQTINLI